MKHIARYHHKSIILFLLVMLFLFSGCEKQESAATQTESPTATPDSPALDTQETESSQNNFVDKLTEDEAKDYYGDYKETGGQIALVIDNSDIGYKCFNEDAYEGVKTFAMAAGVSYSYYKADDDSREAYMAVLRTAILNNAELIVCGGSQFEQAVGTLQDSNPDVSFLLLDGVPRDSSGKALPISPNVHCITYREEEAGYLAGYLTVMEGYTHLGFIGGEELPSVERYGIGYVKGIDDAAKILDKSDEITVDYWYAGTFHPDEKAEAESALWYESGTEIIFVCGGSLYESVLSSADKCDGLLIGVDVDQSDISERFLTSAMKGVKSSVIIALDEYLANGFLWPEEMSGKEISCGATEKCISLPVTEPGWRFKNVTLKEYYNLLSSIKNEEIEIPTDPDAIQKVSVNVVYHHSGQEEQP